MASFQTRLAANFFQCAIIITGHPMAQGEEVKNLHSRPTLTPFALGLCFYLVIALRV